MGKLVSNLDTFVATTEMLRFYRIARSDAHLSVLQFHIRNRKPFCLFTKIKQLTLHKREQKTQSKLSLH